MQDFDRERDVERDVEIERVEYLEGLKADFAKRVAAAVEAYQHGGADLERQLDQEAQALPGEVVEECKAANVRAWGRARPKPALKVVPKVGAPILIRRLLGPEPKPKSREKVVEDSGPSEIGAAQIVSGEAKSRRLRTLAQGWRRLGPSRLR